MKKKTRISRPSGLPRDAERLCDRLHTAASWDERFAIATTELARRRESGPAVDPEVAAAWHWMAHSSSPSGIQPE